MRLIQTTGLLVLLLSGCASFEKWDDYEDEQEQQAIEEFQSPETMPNEVIIADDSVAVMEDSSVATTDLYQGHYSQKYKAINHPYRDNQSGNHGKVMVGSMNAYAYNAPLTKNINHYVRGLMHDMVANLQYVNSKTPIGVTSFVFLDGPYDQSSILGNQISESFIHEVHKFGIPVLDFKTTDYIRITQSGDYVFSRDFLELEPNLPIEYVLGGTLVKHQAGYLVNARIIGIDSKSVVASAQGFIPEHVASALFNSGLKDGIKLVQGED